MNKATYKAPKNKLSSDMPEVTRHKWKKGEWVKGAVEFMERTDVCIYCGCERQMVKHYTNGKLFTDVVAYHRSKQSYGAEHIPVCWGAKNP